MEKFGGCAARNLVGRPVNHLEKNLVRMNHAVAIVGNYDSLIERLENAHHVRQPVWPLAFHPGSLKSGNWNALLVSARAFILSKVARCASCSLWRLDAPDCATTQDKTTTRDGTTTQDEVKLNSCRWRFLVDPGPPEKLANGTA